MKPDSLFIREKQSISQEGLCIHQWFEQVAASFPEAAAIHEGDKYISYKELNARANRIAGFMLERLPAGYQNPICIYTPSSIAFVVAKLAILKIGCSYVPLDVKYPAARLQSVIQQTETPFVFTDSETAGMLPGVAKAQINVDTVELFAPYSAENPRLNISWERLAYLIFTSGSTGESKGVMITHKNLVHLICWVHQHFEMPGGQNSAQTARIVFDASVWEYWSALLCGNTVHILPLSIMLDMDKGKQWLSKNQIHYLFMPTPIGELYLESDWQPSTDLKHLQLGGERLRKRPAPDFPAQVTNIYGPSECTICLTTKTLEATNPLHINPSIGKPVDNSNVYILDENLVPVPWGESGEIYIGGALVGAGYWKQDDLTKQTFLPDPFTGEPGALMYKTGDLAYLYPDGDLDFIGRIDFQVKIRGYRIELGEIETVLHRHPAISECIVQALEVSVGTLSLVAYYTLRQAVTFRIEELKALAKSRLTDYMIPDYYVELPAFPLTNNGKIDRKALPLPSTHSDEYASGREIILPETALEIRVAEIWKTILNQSKLSMNDRFYELGGHSLKATQIISQLRKSLGIGLDIVFMLGNPSLAETVTEIQTKNTAEVWSIPVHPEQMICPLSWAQHGMWYYWQLNNSRVDYNIPLRIDIHGALDIRALQQALDILVQRHETLRTRFFMQDGQPMAQTLPPRPAAFSYAKISPSLGQTTMLTDQSMATSLFPYPVQSASLDTLCEQMGQIRFDLDAGYLMQMCLADCGADHYVLFLTIHHIITDGWSMGIFIRDLRLAYTALIQGNEPVFEAQPIRYADFVMWQKSTQPQQRYPQQLAYWKQTLLPFAPAWSWREEQPIDAEVPNPGKRIWWKLDTSLSRKIDTLTAKHGKSLFSLLLCIYKVLLLRYTQETDIVVGSSFAGRQLAETENLFGIMTNLIPLRAVIEPERSFEMLWDAVQHASATAFVNADYPYDQLILDVGYDPQSEYYPPFNHVFILQNYAMDQADFAGLQMHLVEIGNQTSKFDLLLIVEEWRGEYICWLEYNPDLIDTRIIDNMSRQFVHLCEQIVLDTGKSVSDYEVLLPTERTTLIKDWNATQADFPTEFTYPELFRAVVADHPEALACRYENAQLSYAELDSLSDALAQQLISRGIASGSVVAIALPRCLLLPALYLSSWKAGAAYLPLDIALPPERMSFMLKDSSAALLITTPALQATLPADIPTWCPDLMTLPEPDLQQQNSLPPVSPEAIAYIIYTSGSTGLPKGVMISGKNLVNHNLAVQKLFELTPADRVLQFGSFSFDLSVEEIFPTWLSGAACVLRDEQVMDSLDYFLDFIEQAEITVIDIPTAYWHELVHLLAHRSLPASVRLCIIGGEKALASQLALWQQNTAPHVRLLNTYGPTETTIIATAYEPLRPDTYSEIHLAEDTPENSKINLAVRKSIRSKINLAVRASESSVFPIGKPISNVQTYILDSQLRPVPIGAVGELYIAGRGVGLGYVSHPELTAQCFIPDPFSASPAARMYKTGDIVKYDFSGNIIFLGRKDAQIKLLGHRIELSEIETHLTRLDGVKSAVVLLIDSDPEHQYLCAYLVAADERPDTALLKIQLSHSLPDYMIPSVFVCIDALPFTTQGKIDRRALPSPDVAPPTHSLTLPGTPLQKSLASIWMKVLNLQQIDINTAFSDLGGHSLKAMLTVSLLEKELHISLSLREFLAHNTIFTLSEFLQREKLHVSTIAEVGLTAAPRTNITYPLSYAQLGLWFLWELDAAKISYNIPMVYHIDGYLDPEIMTQVWQVIFRRHEVFHTRFVLHAGNPELQLDYLSPTILPIIDLSAKPASLAQAQALHICKQTAATAFDLTTGPLYALQLLKLSEDNWQLCLVVHHIIADGWSFAVLSREVKQIYTQIADSSGSNGSEGTSSAVLAEQLPPLMIQSIDYSVWQRNAMTGELLERQAAYWRQNLLPLPAPLQMPCKGLRPAYQTYRGAQIRFDISDRDYRLWNRFCSDHQVSLFMFLFAGLAVLYYKYSDQTDLVIGTPFANRKDAQLEDVVGCFTNMLALRAVIKADESFASLLDHLRNTCLDAYSHSEYPFFLLPQLLQLPRDPSRHPLYQIMLTLLNYPIPMLEFSGLNITTEVIGNSSAKVDMSWDFGHTADVFTGSLEYNTDLFEAEFCQNMTQNLLVILNSVCAQPGQPVQDIPWLSAWEYDFLIHTCNATHQALPPYPTVWSWIAARCAQEPSAPAVGFADHHLSYGELQQRVMAARGELTGYHVQRGEVIGIYLQRGGGMLIQTLAVWSLNAAYLYLDPEFPAERLAFMAEDCRLKLIIADQPLPEALEKLQTQVFNVTELPPDSGNMPAPPSCQGQPHDIAYVIFTSGSTGKPKAVMISQLSVVNFLAAMQQTPGIRDTDVLAAITPMSFDISVLELFLPLVSGAKLIILPRTAALDALLLAKLLHENAVTLFQATPSSYKMLLDSGWAGRTGLVALCGGEALSNSLAQQLLPLVQSLWNMYGPTETTVWSTLYQVTAGHPVLIGKPIANTSVYVLNSELQPAPQGVWGELYIGGKGVATGYLNRPELNAERFIPDPFAVSQAASHPVKQQDKSRCTSTNVAQDSSCAQVEQDADPAETQTQTETQTQSQTQTQTQDKSCGTYHKLYKTGDLVRYTPAGFLEYGGRNDYQVKIRGHRIEPEEIADLLRHHPDIKDAVVAVAEGINSDKYLAAYLIAASEQQPSSSELSSYLSRELPDYMIPVGYLYLEQFPLTANAKIDIKAIPPIGLSPAVPANEHRAPYTPEQEILCRAVAAVLHLPEVSIADNFFALGGNSILTMQLIHHIHRSGLTITLDHLFRHQNLEELASQMQIRLAQTNTFGSESLILLQPGKAGSKPLFLIHPLPGDVLGYVNLVQELSADITIYGIQSLGLTSPQRIHRTIPEMAAYYLSIIKELNIGDYYLGGWCFGGSIAIEMVYQAKRECQPLPQVFLFDTWAFNPAPEITYRYYLHLMKVIIFNWRRLPHIALTKLRERHGYQVIFDQKSIFQDQGIFENRSLVRKTNLSSLYSWKMHRYDCKIVLFRAREQHPDTVHDWTLGWTVFAPQMLIHPVEATHDNILKQPQVKSVAALLSSYLV